MKKKILTVFLSVLISSLSIANDASELTWEMMETLDYQEGIVPKALQDYDNRLVEVAGFIVPLELDDYIDTVKEFILVPNPLACMHIPPPGPNQMIFVTMETAIPLDMDDRGVSITGKLSIPEPIPGETLISFELMGHSAVEADIDFEDPFDEILDLL